MKIDRLLGETIYLLNHKRTSASVLAKHFEVSTRTIMRDMDTLSLAGIPVVANFGQDGGYEIMDTFRIQQMTGDIDYSVIVAALQAFASAYSQKELDQAILKMKALTNAKSDVIMDLSVAHENMNQNELLYMIHQAIQRKQWIQFSYTNGLGQEKELSIEPVYAIYKWYNWYFVGYDEQRDDYRMYKLVRMERLKILEKKHEREFDVEQVMRRMEEKKDTRKMLHVKLLCHASIKSKCKEYLNGVIIKEYEDGTFEYEFEVPEEEQFWYGVVLSFGNKARVLEPEPLITRMKETLYEIMDLYKG